jgi:hypothetical protein
VFCHVCDNMLEEGHITKIQHERYTNIFWWNYQQTLFTFPPQDTLMNALYTSVTICLFGVLTIANLYITMGAVQKLSGDSTTLRKDAITPQSTLKNQEQK